MPKYLIEQYEIHSQSFRVEAENEAHAIKKLFDRQAQPEDNGLEYIEVANDLGLPADTYPDLAKALREHGIDTDDVIPSIRDITEV
ncbi:MAG: hypothetical protein K8T91_04380 [Planctomycetes bacterium]|nr:hypothetical protein [Planctomycetota bacterium]